MFTETPCITRLIPVKRRIPGIEFTPGTSNSSFSKPKKFERFRVFLTLTETLINHEPDQKNYLPRLKFSQF